MFTNVELLDSKKGFDKSIWVVAMIVLVLMFVAVFFGGITEWLDSGAGELMDITDDWQEIGESDD